MSAELKKLIDNYGRACVAFGNPAWESKAGEELSAALATHAGAAAAVAPLTGRTHELKTDGPVFAELQAGRKLFEIRKDDRAFQCGDILRLRETRCTGAEMAAGAPLIYTGQEEARRVIGILRGPKYGLSEGWVIMSVAALTSAPAVPEALLDQIDELCSLSARQASETIGGFHKTARELGLQFVEKRRQIVAELKGVQPGERGEGGGLK